MSGVLSDCAWRAVRLRGSRGIATHRVPRIYVRPLAQQLPRRLHLPVERCAEERRPVHLRGGEERRYGHCAALARHSAPPGPCPSPAPHGGRPCRPCWPPPAAWSPSPCETTREAARAARLWRDVFRSQLGRRGHPGPAEAAWRTCGLSAQQPNRRAQNGSTVAKCFLCPGSAAVYPLARACLRLLSEASDSLSS